MSVKGEKYSSKKAMMKHERGETGKERMKEYGSKSGGMKAKKTVAKKSVAKKGKK